MFFRVAGYLSDATASWAAPAVVFTVFFLPGTLDSRPEICRLYETSKRFKEAVRPEPPGHRPSRGPSYRFFACGGEGRQGGTFPNVASAARVVPKRTGYPTPQAAAPRRSMRAPGLGWRSCRPPPFVSTAFGPPCRRPVVHRRARSLSNCGAAPRHTERSERACAGACTGGAASAHIATWVGTNIKPVADRESFLQTVEWDVLGLHQGSYAGHRITPAESNAWRRVRTENIPESWTPAAGRSAACCTTIPNLP